MNLVLKKIFGLLLIVFFVVSLSSDAKASEGTVDLNNVNGGSTRCFAASVLMGDFSYKILMSCRDLIYPGSTQVYNYTLWAQEANSEDIFRLGTLGLGKGEYETDKAFSRLFVTQETSSKPRNPSDRLVMSGTVQAISILEGSSTVVVNTESDQPAETSLENNQFVNPSPQQKTVPQDQAAKAFSVIKIAVGILFAIIIFVVVVALVSASRRRPIE